MVGISTFILTIFLPYALICTVAISFSFSPYINLYRSIVIFSMLITGFYTASLIYMTAAFPLSEGQPMILSQLFLMVFGYVSGAAMPIKNSAVSFFVLNILLRFSSQL